MSANNISVRDLQALNIDISGITLYTLSADFFYANDVSANRINVGALTATDLSANIIYTTAILAAQSDPTILPLTMGTTTNPSAISINDTQTIIQTAINPSAITINNTQTIIQNADLSGTVSVGNGDVSGALIISSGAEGNASLYVNTPTDGTLTLGSSLTNPAGVTIQDTSIYLLRDVYINNENGFQGALKISSSIGGNAKICVADSSGELVLGSSLNNPTAITITDTATTIQNTNLLGTVSIGNGDVSGALQILSGAEGSAFLYVNTPANGSLTLGSSLTNLNSVQILDTNINLFKDIYINNETTAEGRLRLSSTLGGEAKIGVFDVSGELVLASSGNNPNAIIIRDTGTTIANSLTVTSLNLQNASNPQLRIGDLSANNLSVTSIAGTGAIASSLSATSRGLVDQQIDLSGIGTRAGNLGFSDWSYNWVATGDALKYSTFLVTVDAVLDSSGISSQGTINIGTGTHCYYRLFAYKSTAQYINLSYTFIVPLNPPLVNLALNTITIYANANGPGSGRFFSAGPAGAYFINTIPYFGNPSFYTTINIIGIA
jgi:hypothetical protein